LEKTAMSAIILAGGKSSRMGENKLLLPLGDTTVIGHLVKSLSGLFAQCIVVTDDPEPYRALPVITTGDLFPCSVRNSLVGIYSGLLASGHSYNLVVAGDMPFLAPALAGYLCLLREGYDVVLPRQGRHLQPLCAVYHRRCCEQIEQFLSTGRYRVTDLFDYLHVLHVDTEELKPYDPELLSFFNLNTPEDYLLAQEIYANIKEAKE